MPRIEALEGIDLKVYSSGWCPDCRRLDRWLEEAGVTFARVDIEREDGAAQRLERETGKRAIPYVLVNDARWVRGYHRELPGRFDPRLFVEEVLAARGGPPVPGVTRSSSHNA